MRSRARTEFLTDILITAVEGGINYWARVDDYSPKSGTARLTDAEDPETNWKVTLDVIAKGVNAIAKADPGTIAYLPTYMTGLVKACNRANDLGPANYQGQFVPGPTGGGWYASDIDAAAADVIVQVGLFNEVVYG